MSSYRFSSHKCKHPKRQRACEKRGNKRLLCSDLIQASWPEGPHTRRTEIAILENISSSGVGLFCGVSVPIGVAIELSFSEKSLRGRVKHCQFRENGYLVGVELDPAQDLGGEFRPEHILDVSLLNFE